MEKGQIALSMEVKIQHLLALQVYGGFKNPLSLKSQFTPELHKTLS